MLLGNAHFYLDCIFWTNAIDAFIPEWKKNVPGVKETRWRSSPFDPLFMLNTHHIQFLHSFSHRWPTRKCFSCVRNNNVTNFNIFVNNSPHTHTHVAKLLKNARLTLSSEHSCAASASASLTKKNSNCGLVQCGILLIRAYIHHLLAAEQKNQPKESKRSWGAGRVNLKQFSGNTGDNGHSLYANPGAPDSQQLTVRERERKNSPGIFCSKIHNRWPNQQKKSPSLSLSRPLWVRASVLFYIQQAEWRETRLSDSPAVQF